MAPIKLRRKSHSGPMLRGNSLVRTTLEVDRGIVSHAAENWENLVFSKQSKVYTNLVTWWGEIWIWLESRELRKQDKILESIAFFAWWSLWMWTETFHASLPRWNRRCNPDQAPQFPGKCPRLLILQGPSQKSLFSPPRPEQNKHIRLWQRVLMHRDEK